MEQRFNYVRTISALQTTPTDVVTMGLEYYTEWNIDFVDREEFFVTSVQCFARFYDLVGAANYMIRSDYCKSHALMSRATPTTNQRLTDSLPMAAYTVASTVSNLYFETGILYDLFHCPLSVQGNLRFKIYGAIDAAFVPGGTVKFRPSWIITFGFTS